MAKSNTQKAYERNRKRLQEAVKKAEKRGYEFTSQVIPDRPKKITQASVRRLEKIKTEDIYKKARFIDYETGEIIEGVDFRKYEKEQAKQRKKERKRQKEQEKQTYETHEEQQYNYDSFPNEADIVITQFYFLLDKFPEKAEPIIKPIIERLINTRGKEDVALMLQSAADAGLVLDYKVAYSDTLLNNYISELLDFLPDIGAHEKQDIMDAYEWDEDWEMPE